MLDWLVEVTTTFKCSEKTYYLAVALFDNFLFAFPAQLQNNDVHGIGITALYISSKCEDTHSLSSEVISERISHGAYTPAQIKAREMIMLRTLEFSVDLVTFYDLHFNLMRYSHLKSKISNLVFTKISELSTMILLMSMQYPKF